MTDSNNLSDFPLVSIISINYDHPEVTCAMLESMRKVTYPNIELIIVDNASPNDDPAILKQNYPEIIFIQSEKNLGFPGGNDLGIRKAKGKYILLLNNDTEVTPEFLEPLVAKMENNPEIGIVSPKIKFFDPPQLLQYCGITPINLLTIRSKGIGFEEVDNGQYNTDTEQAYAHGAAMMVRREAIEKVGMMADIYFLYYEELDWCYRIRQAGYKIWYVHNSLIFHKESVSTGRLSPFRTFYINRARLLYMRRHVKGLALLFAVFYQIFAAFPKNTIIYIIKLDFKSLQSYVNAFTWIIKNWFNPKIHENPML
jgi:GT2 family glycosyltransferase